MRDLTSKIICAEKNDVKKDALPPDPLAEKFLKTRQILLSGEVNKELA